MKRKPVSPATKNPETALRQALLWLGASVFAVGLVADTLACSGSSPGATGGGGSRGIGPNGGSNDAATDAPPSTGSSQDSGPSSGSSGGQATASCGFDYTTQACAACHTEYCCTAEQTCANDEACAILLRCMLACGADETCLDACGSSVPTTALTELATALNCGSSNCTSACTAPVDAGVSCGSTPTLHPSTPGSVYCGAGSNGASLTCSGQDQCCLGGALGGGTYASEDCTPFGSGCTNGGELDAGGSLAVPIECGQVADCRAKGASNAVACCLQSATTPAVPPGCSYPKATLGSAVACETTACGDGETTICSSQADCPAGTTCTPGKWKIYQIGFCL